jgi:flavin-dependent dehydrogenase
LNLDIAIIGASSSGLYAAEQLARAGRRVAIFERESELNPARRTYIITPQLMRLLGDLPKPALLHRIQVMAVVTPGARVEVPFQQPDLVVERHLFIQFMAQRAREAGVEFHLGCRFLGFDLVNGHTALNLRTPGGVLLSVTPQAVIGADGVFSQVARAAGIRRPPHVPIVQAEIKLPPDWDPSLTQVWFDTQDTPYFYWLIPESEERGVLGLVGDDPAETGQLLEDFLARQGFQPLAYQAGQVALHHPRLRPWGRIGSLPVLLVGDAAGQVKVTTVGGTVTGLYGARAAARALLRGTSYAHELRSLKRELDVHWLIRALLERMDNPGYDQLVASLNPAIVRFLGRRNRDEIAGAIWQLPLLQPRLMGLGLRLLFRRLNHRPPIITTSHQ